MKKLIIFIMICALTISLCACGIKTITYPDGQKKGLSDQFIIIKEINGGVFDNTCYYIYDNDTKIVYLYTCGGSHATMCPYYIIEDGVPAIAVYGVNWNG